MADTDTLANILFPPLVAGTDFSYPSVDLTGPEFTIPTTVDNPLYAEVSPLAEGDLTERKVNGTGMFDGLMESIKEHLTEEYRANRMSGTEYREAYVALTQTAMSAAVQYLLSKDATYWQAAIAQQQARAAEAEVVNARVRLELEKVQLKTLMVDKATKEVQYANMKQQLATTEAQYDLIQKQIEVADAEMVRTAAQKDQILYQTASLLPSQKGNIDAEKDVKVYQLTNLYPSQVAKTTAETLAQEYSTQFILPAQKFNLEEQAEANRAKTLDTRSDAATVAGAIGKQKDLHSEQITSYKRDAETKVAKLNLDLWMTAKSIDEGTNPPTIMDVPSFNVLFTNLRNNVGLG